MARRLWIGWIGFGFGIVYGVFWVFKFIIWVYCRNVSCNIVWVFRVVSWWRVEVGCLQEIIYINLKLSIVYYYNTCTGRI